MTVENLREIALKLISVTEDIKWEDHLCFNIGGKMFLVTAPDALPSGASFKVAAEDFDAVISREGFTKHVYLGRYHWVHLDDINRVETSEWKTLIEQSYRLVSEKLTKKAKKELGLL